MSGVSQILRDQVRDRANGRCEYCGIPEEAQVYPFHVEHIIARKHNGLTVLENLAWSCFDCNVSKGTDVAGYDENTGELAPLYNPRDQQWPQHFTIKDGHITGISPTGRVTVHLLKFNAGERVAERAVLMEANLWAVPTPRS